jgi:hypothetical protein
MAYPVFVMKQVKQEMKISQMNNHFDLLTHEPSLLTLGTTPAHTPWGLSTPSQVSDKNLVTMRIDWFTLVQCSEM